MTLREVVGAVIVQNGRALLTQRRPGKSFAYCHESPGGKVDPGESHHEALRREAREELGIEIGRIPEHPLWCGYVDSPDGRAFVLLYLVTEWTGEPTPREGQGLGWFEACEIPALVMTPANVAAMDEVIRAAKASARVANVEATFYRAMANEKEPERAPTAEEVRRVGEAFEAAGVRPCPTCGSPLDASDPCFPTEWR